MYGVCERNPLNGLIRVIRTIKKHLLYATSVATFGDKTNLKTVNFFLHFSYVHIDRNLLKTEVNDGGGGRVQLFRNVGCGTNACGENVFNLKYVFESATSAQKTALTPDCPRTHLDRVGKGK